MAIEKTLKSVLIIESDQGMRTLVSNYVKGFGATPVEAASPGPEALNLIDNNVYDLAIIDWKSKSPSGPELYAMLREHPLNQDVFIIFISGQVTKDDILSTIKDPKAKFVVKPFTEEVLFKAVNDFYKGRLKPQNDKSKNFSIQKGEAQQKGLDLSIHKTDGRVITGLDKVRGEGIGSGFNATQSRDLLPTGEDMRVHGTRDSDLSWEEQNTEGMEYEIDSSDDELDYAPAQGRKGELGKGIGQEKGVTRPNAFAWDDDEKEMEALTQRLRELGMKDSAKKAAGKEYGAKGPENPSYAEEEGRRAPSKSIGKAEGLASSAKRHGSIDGGAENKRPVGNELGKAGQDKKPVRAAQAQDQMSKKSSSYSPTSTDGMISDIDLDDEPKISDIDDSESKITYSKKAIKSGSPIKYGMNQKIHMLNRKPGSNSLDVLIIDDDQGLTNLVQNYLAKERSDFVDVCQDAIEGWKLLQKFKYNLVVMDWNSKGFSGLALYNRLRSNPKFRRIPVIILTGSMARENFRIIEDNKCTMVLEKPFELHIFKNAVESIRKSEKTDSQIIELACQIVNMHKGNRKKIYQSLKATTTKIPCKFDFLLAAGQYLYYLQEYRLAQKVYEDAAIHDPKSITLMTEMAKVHLRLDHPVESLRLLTEANHFSPGNIERLCLMGEAGLDLFQTDKAQEYFRRALQIDDENLTARQGTVVSKNLADYLKSLDKSMPLREKFASTLNLIGITYIKNNQINNGIEQYHCAMAFIHDLPTISRLQFNLGLAYYRSGDHRLALEWLSESIKNSSPSFKKPQIWFDKIQSSQGESLMEDAESESLEWDSDEFVDSLADSLKNMMDNPEAD